MTFYYELMKGSILGIFI